MRDARVEEVDHLSDSDSEDKDAETTDLTLGIFPNHQGPTYLLCPGKQVNRNTDRYQLFYVINRFL